MRHLVFTKVWLSDFYDFSLEILLSVDVRKHTQHKTYMWNVTCSFFILESLQRFSYILCYVHRGWGGISRANAALGMLSGAEGPGFDESCEGMTTAVFNKHVLYMGEQEDLRQAENFGNVILHANVHPNTNSKNIWLNWNCFLVKSTVNCSFFNLMFLWEQRFK